MNVNDLREKIVELGHQTAGDAEVNGRALGWLNAAYHELMDELVAYAPAALQELEEVTTDVQGSVTLAAVPYRVLKVVNRSSGEVLPVVDKAAVLEADPLGKATGTPKRCVVEDASVVVHPAGVCALAVLYVPAAEDLVEDGNEASVLLPRPHHQALVWGGLVWSALFERGFGGVSELAMYQRQWVEAKERVKLSLLGGSGQVLRVQPFDIV